MKNSTVYNAPSNSDNLLNYFDQSKIVFELIDEKRVEGLFLSKEEFFSKIQINAIEYKLLLAACFEVIKGNLELLIVLDINSEEIKKYVFGLLVYLNRGIPVNIRRILCFTVIDNKIKIENIEFASKKASKIKKDNDIIFNFMTRKIVFTNRKFDGNLYLDFVWSNLNNVEMLKKFQNIANILNENKLDLADYEELVKIFKINESRYNLSDDERYKNLTNFYNNVISNIEFNKKKCYVELFYNIFEVEMEKKKHNRRQYLPLEDIIKMAVSFCEIVDIYFTEQQGETIKKQLNAYLILVIIDGREEGKLAYVSKVFLMAHSNKIMFKNLIDNLFINTKFVDGILKWYILIRLAEANSLDKLLNEVKFWGEVSAKVIAMDFFAQHIENNILNIIKESNQKVSLCIKVYNYFDNFQSSYATEQDKSIYLQCSQKIKNNIYEYMFGIIDLSKIKKDELIHIKLQKCDRYKEEQKIITYTQQLFKYSDNFRIRVFEKEICKLSQEVAFNIQNLIKEYYVDDIDYNNFRKIMVGFVEETVYVSDVILYNFNDLMRYIYNNGGVDKSRKFIVWVADEFNELEDNMVFNRFRSAIIVYFKQYDSKAFCEKGVNEIFQCIKNERVRRLLKEIKANLPGGFARIIGKIERMIKK